MNKLICLLLLFLSACGAGLEDHPDLNVSSADPCPGITDKTKCVPKLGEPHGQY